MTIKSSKFFPIALIAWIFVLVSCFPLVALGAAAPVQHQLSQEELANLVKPAVVRIINQVKGNISIQPFDIDLNTLQAIPPTGTAASQPPIQKSLDEVLTGSGFVVSSDGYIITNSHVISSTQSADKLLADTWAAVLQAKIATLGKPQSANVQADLQNRMQSLSQSQSNDLEGQILDSLKKFSKIDATATITVLNPASTADNLSEQVSGGFPAEIVAYNSNYALDQKDIGLIKIDRQNLPVLPLTTSSGLVSGAKMYIFSFPATATFNRQDWLEGSFTQGVISAIKDSDSKDFKIFETDAKISAGSSGSPLINSLGQVVGIVTYESNATDSNNSGDNFAFALPAELASQVLADHHVTNSATIYEQPFIQILNFIDQHSCQLANAQLLKLKIMDPDFAANLNVQQYQDKVSQLEQSGGCLDNNVDIFKSELSHIPIWVWPAAVAAILLAVLLVSVLRRQSREIAMEEQELHIDEEKIAQLEKEIHPTSAVPIPTPAAQPPPANNQTPPTNPSA